MPIDDDPLVLGLTGAFGSGCTSLAETLASTKTEDMQFTMLRISTLIKESWKPQELGEQGVLPTDRPTREQQQDIGDTGRRDHGNGYWVERAIDRLDEKPNAIKQIVLDGIRNPGEVEYLRDRFVRFFLVAVDAPLETRWEWLQKTDEWRTRSRDDFLRMSSRDAASHLEYGQQVQLCVDLADSVITNDETRDAPKLRSYFLSRATDLLRLANGILRRPFPEEVFMHLAFASSAASACLKRNVGAVIVRPKRQRDIAIDSKIRQIEQVSSVVSVGFNENPDWMRPCFEEYEACFRDLWMNETLRQIGPKHCPSCGNSLTPTDSDMPSGCPSCSSDLRQYFFPERAMTHCTAIHAEVRAIQSAGAHDLTDSHLYSTTFPCFLCAEQIVQANIANVVYVEPYPDERAEQFLLRRGVTLQRFSGVKSQAFSRLFGSWRPDAEIQYSLDKRIIPRTKGR